MVTGTIGTHTFIKFSILYGYSSSHTKAIIIVTSNITDHRLRKIIIMKNLKYCKNYQTVTQRHTVSKSCWKNCAHRLEQRMVATNLQSAENTLSAKCNKTRCPCVCLVRQAFVRSCRIKGYVLHSSAAVCTDLWGPHSSASFAIISLSFSSTFYSFPSHFFLFLKENPPCHHLL